MQTTPTILNTTPLLRSLFARAAIPTPKADAYGSIVENPNLSEFEKWVLLDPKAHWSHLMQSAPPSDPFHYEGHPA